MNFRAHFTFTLFVLAIAGGAQAQTGNLPQLRNGDLIFRKSRTAQTDAIIMASNDPKHPYSHVGIVEVKGGKVFVIEAVSPKNGEVDETPIEDWVSSEYAQPGTIGVYRDENLTVGDQNAIVSRALAYKGRRYDRFFYFGNKEIYCSELAYLAYDRKIGEVKKFGQLNINNSAVDKLIQDRWRKHPLCLSKGARSEQECRHYLDDMDLITPASIAASPRVHRIYPEERKTSWPFGRRTDVAEPPGDVSHSIL